MANGQKWVSEYGLPNRRHNMRVTEFACILVTSGFCMGQPSAAPVSARTVLTENNDYYSLDACKRETT